MNAILHHSLPKKKITDNKFYTILICQVWKYSDTLPIKTHLRQFIREALILTPHKSTHCSFP